MTGFH